MLEKISTIFFTFIIYSFLGWCLEVVAVGIDKRKFINRGFLIGPYCPIYGFGSLIMVMFLKKYQDDIIALFVMSVIICSIIEYLTSYIMEKMFKARWWDYSKKSFNINGRICLQNAVVFGLFGCLIIHYINPFVVSIVDAIPIIPLIIMSIILFIVFVTDNVISFNVINSIKNVTFEAKKDNTDQITEKVKEILKNKSLLSKRLVNAFPDFYTTLKVKKEELEEKTKEISEEIKNRIQEKKDKIEEIINTKNR